MDEPPQTAFALSFLGYSLIVAGALFSDRIGVGLLILAGLVHVLVGRLAASEWRQCIQAYKRRDFPQ